MNENDQESALFLRPEQWDKIWAELIEEAESWEYDEDGVPICQMFSTSGNSD